MSAFTQKTRTIAHPDWLRSALTDFAKTQRLYSAGNFPKALEFPMMAVPIHRLMRCCFSNRWAMLWWLFVDTLDHERQQVYGFLYRFWRYRIRLKSQEADFNRLISQNCPHCRKRCTFSVPVPACSDKSVMQCDGCSALSDFEDRFLAGDDDSDEDE